MTNVQKTFELFVLTLPLQNMDVEDPRFEDLYEKECEIFEHFRTFTKEEMSDYRKLVSNHFGKTVEEYYENEYVDIEEVKRKDTFQLNSEDEKKFLQYLQEENEYEIYRHEKFLYNKLHP